MLTSKRIETTHPYSKSSLLSKLVFGWIYPILTRGKRYGLRENDLTSCLDNNQSDLLGSALEREWNNECLVAEQNKRKPKLIKPLVKLFAKDWAVQGISIFHFILLRSLLPVVLAQLLKQFPNSHTPSPELYNSTDWNETNEFKFDTNTTGDILESTYSLYKDWWNNDKYLATGVILIVLISSMLNHHADMKLRMIGARLRISCSSLIFRKVLKLSQNSATHTSGGFLINLLSNDVSRLDNSLIYLHHVWLMPFQCVLVTYLLYQQIQYAAYVGVFCILIKTLPVQTYLSKVLSKLRMKIAKESDFRISIMNEIIKGIQMIKMFAWEKAFEKIVSIARRNEIKQIRWASQIRGIHLSTMVFTERSTLFLTFAFCALMNNFLTADTIFSMAQFFNTLQLTAAIFYPMAMALGAEALVSIDRIEKFLQLKERSSTVEYQASDKKSPVQNVLQFDAVCSTWKDATNPVLSNINLQIEKGSLCVILGSVGCGKSSLLQLMIGELPPISGSAKVNGQLSYASQEPWLFSGTVRQNIIMGLAFDEQKYNEVIKCCSLEKDFANLKHGDQTTIGESGSSLSGGQKTRIGLARCVYREADIYLLDDPLSAVDTQVAGYLVKNLISAKGYLAKQGASRIVVTHQVNLLQEADWIVIMDKGKIVTQGNYEHIQGQNISYLKLAANPELNENADDLTTVKKSMKVQTNDEEDDDNDIDEDTINERQSMLKLAEKQSSGNVPWKIWKNYLTYGGNSCRIFVIGFVLILSQFIISGSDYFVNYCATQNFLRSTGIATFFTSQEELIIYSILIISVIVFTIYRGILFFNYCMQTSRNMHDDMFTKLLKAQMLYFGRNPSGRILNRFSKDMGIVDEFLPKVFMEAIQIALVICGIITVVSFMDPNMLFPLPIIVLLFSYVVSIYLKPAQDLKRLDGITRSPMYSHVSASLYGLQTIRSHEIQPMTINEFDKLQNKHTSCWEIIMAANTAFGLWLDLISSIFITCVTLSFVAFSRDALSANMGLAISQSLILTGMVQYGIKQTAETVQCMTSVERILQFTEIDQEPFRDSPVAKEWPQSGRIQFVNMSLHYDQDEDPVLKEINLEIDTNWKVGVIGRTGAGKSSLIAALFRLAHMKGQILIDNVDTDTIPLDQLRSKISIIPQHPTLFTTTLRYNLDPFEMCTDDEIWSALERVEMKNSVEHLDEAIIDGGRSLSAGQKQLLCLARAMLRKSKIIILDEATANIDGRTDEIIQRIISKFCESCTVITIAHRLQTVMNSDRIIVMDQGRVVEYDKPSVLINKPGGLLVDLIEAAGQQEAHLLRAMVEKRSDLQE